MRNCEYLKPNGEFCGSPALRGRDHCHWHLICVARRLRAEKQEATQDRTPSSCLRWRTPTRCSWR